MYLGDRSPHSGLNVYVICIFFQFFLDFYLTIFFISSPPFPNHLLDPQLIKRYTFEGMYKIVF